MKRTILTGILACALLLGPLSKTAMAAQTSFADVSPDDWFYSSVTYSQEHNLITGTDDATFSPNQPITRAMFLTLLYRLEGMPAATGVTFLDVPEGSWYAGPIAWARSNQLVFGYGDGRFGPDDVLKREHMVLILYRYAEFKGYDLNTDGVMLPFSDTDLCSDELAVTALRWALSVRLINGMGGNRVEPLAAATRAHVAALLARFDQNVELPEDRAILSDFVSETTELIVGDECSITFTVKVSGTVEDKVYLCAGGQRLVEMRDDGRDGDSQAGDGVYTGVWTTTYPAAATVECYIVCGEATSRRISVRFLDGGTVTGLVCGALDESVPLPNATLHIYRDGWLYTTATSDENGRYVLRLPYGSYHIRVVVDGYVIFNSYVTVSAGNNTYTETYRMVEGAQNAPGHASGTITSALTGQSLEGIHLTVRNGWNNTTVGDVVATGVTDANGSYFFDLPVGNYTIYATRDGYISIVINIIVTVDGVSSQNGSISPVVTSGDYRVVLTWGENPKDLDSHLSGETSSGSPYHVYYSDKDAYDGGTRVCNLDVDDTTSYGPETVTLTTTEGRSYYYYVHRFSGSGSLATSGAIVRLYRGDALLANFNVPTDQGTADIWNVFAIKDGQIVIRDTITGTPDTTYAQQQGSTPETGAWGSLQG